MDLSQPPSSGRESPAQAAPVADPRLQPTPDYGTLGASLDASGPDPISRQSTNPMRVGPFLAAAVGALCALLAGSISRSPVRWTAFANLFSRHENAASRKSASPGDSRQLDRMKPQKQAETLLELAVARSEGATDQIASRVDRWQGKVRWNSEIATLTTAATLSPWLIRNYRAFGRLVIETKSGFNLWSKNVFRFSKRPPLQGKTSKKSEGANFFKLSSCLFKKESEDVLKRK